MKKEFNSKDLFMYALAQMQKRRYATAQAFWVFAFEYFIKEKYEKELKLPVGEANLCTLYEELKRRNNLWFLENKSRLYYLKRKRNEIIHQFFISDDEFRKLMDSFRYLLYGDNKNMDELKESIDAESIIDLALKFGDRKFFEREEVERYKKLEAKDFYNSLLFEKKIWALKYHLDDLFEISGFSNLETGLISDFNVESEWIWVPIGFEIKKGNKRVRSTIISILILRNKTIRIYLDFGTEAIKQRLKYYEKLINEEKFRKALGNLQNYSEITFFNVEHYSLITTKYTINDLFDENADLRNECKNLIEYEINEIKNRQEHRSNILLFGKESELKDFPYELNELALKIFDTIKLLTPFLRGLS